MAMVSWVAVEANPKKRKAGDMEGGKGKGKPKSIVDLLVVKATRTKTRYLQLTGQCTALLHQVNCNPAYSWINHHIINPVVDSHTKLQAKLTTFTLDMVSGESIQELKKKYGEFLEDRLREAIGIEADLNSLQQEMDIVMKMQAARGQSSS
jgi:hypothetical protein